MEVTDELKILAELLKTDGEKNKGTQNYIELSEDGTCFYNNMLAEYPLKDVCLKNHKTLKFNRACAYSLMVTTNTFGHVLYHVGADRSGLVGDILELNKDLWVDVNDSVILIPNINQKDGNTIGRFIISLRAPHEMKNESGYKAMLEHGIPKIVAMHLCYIVRKSYDEITYCGTHQAYSHSPSETSIQKLIGWVLEGNNMWQNTTKRPYKQGTTRWEMRTHDFKQFCGQGIMNAVTKKRREGVFGGYEAQLFDSFLEHASAIIKTTTIKLNLEKVLNK